MKKIIFGAMAAAAMLYIFGEKGIWYNLIAILISNLLSIFLIIQQHGLGNFLSEFITLIVTFAGEVFNVERISLNDWLWIMLITSPVLIIPDVVRFVSGGVKKQVK